jgi:hypothetical protein
VITLGEVSHYAPLAHGPIPSHDQYPPNTQSSGTVRRDITRLWSWCYVGYRRQICPSSETVRGAGNKNTGQHNSSDGATRSRWLVMKHVKFGTPSATHTYAQEEMRVRYNRTPRIICHLSRVLRSDLRERRMVTGDTMGHVEWNKDNRWKRRMMLR